MGKGCSAQSVGRASLFSGSGMPLPAKDYLLTVAAVLLGFALSI